jgi:hypothetical protein
MDVGHDREALALAKLRQGHVARVLKHDVTFVKAARAEFIVVGCPLDPSAASRRKQECAALATACAASLKLAD